MKPVNMTIFTHFIGTYPTPIGLHYFVEDINFNVTIIGNTSVLKLLNTSDPERSQWREEDTLWSIFWSLSQSECNLKSWIWSRRYFYKIVEPELEELESISY